MGTQIPVKNKKRLIYIDLSISDNHINQVVMDKKYPAKSDEWKISTSVMTKNILSVNQHRFPIQHMANNVFDLSTNYKIKQFQVTFMYSPGFNHHITLQYSVIK